MGFWDWLTAPFRKDSAFERLLLSVYGGGPTSSGEPVSPASSIQQAAVYSCVNVISETIGSLPLLLYRRKSGDSIERASKHPLFKILHDRPNRWQTAIEWRQMLQAHLLLRGRAYSFINRAGSPGRETVRELIPIHPDNVIVQQDPESYDLVYRVSTSTGSAEFKQAEIFHLRGLTLDGIDGVSPISYCRETIGLALAAERHGARVFGNGARPSGVLVSPNTMKKEAVKELSDSWTEAYGGTNSGRIAVLHGGLDFKPISMTSNDAQFLETRKFQRSEIAALFRVPPHMIGDLERATFSNIEHQSLEFVAHALQSWLVRWEQAISRDLLREDEREEFFAEHLVAGLMRGDIKSRYGSYAIGRQWGWLSVNDIRRMENFNPVEGGDVYLQPMNMIPSGSDPNKDILGDSNAVKP